MAHLRAPYIPPDLCATIHGRRDLRPALMNAAVRLDLAGTPQRAALVAAMAEGPHAVRRILGVSAPAVAEVAEHHAE